MLSIIILSKINLINIYILKKLTKLIHLSEFIFNKYNVSNSI